MEHVPRDKAFRESRTAKKQLWRFFLAMAAVSLLFFFQEARAQIPGPDAARVEDAELENAIRLLEDPAETRRLAAELKGILAARKLALERKKTGPPKGKTGVLDLFALYADAERQLGRMQDRLKEAGEFLALQVRRISDYVLAEENQRKMISAGVEILLALIPALTVWLLLRRAALAWQRRLGGAENRSRQGIRAGLAALLQVYPWVAAYVFLFVLLLFLSPPPALKLFLLQAGLALVGYKGLVYLLARFFGADLRSEAWIPLKAETGRYIFIWAKRTLLFCLWALIFFLAAYYGEMPSVAEAASLLFRIGLVGFAVAILAHFRHKLDTTFRMSPRPGKASWLSRFKRSANYVAGKAYLFVLLYAGFLSLLFLGSSEIYSFVAASSAKSVLIVLATAGAVWLWSFLFRRLSQASLRLQECYPTFSPLCRSIDYVKKAGYAAVLLLGILGVLQVWGLAVYSSLFQKTWVNSVLRISFILLFALLFIQLAFFLIQNFARQTRARMLAGTNASPAELEKRISTLANIFQRVVAVTVGVFAGIMIFSELGFDIKPVLAGAGIIGLAVGFGAQNLVRDVISGLFYTFENRIRVGDVAVINGTGGLVEQVNLRTTVLRGLDGTVHVFPNGGINTLSNMTYEYSYYVFDVGVAYKEDVDRVSAVLKEVGSQIMEEDDYRQAILEPLEIMGVDKFADSAVVIKARIKTIPIKQWFVGREMNRRIKKRFDELGIEIPFPHQSLYFGEASKPLAVRLEGVQERKEEIKAWIREILEEAGRGAGAASPTPLSK